MRPGRAQLLLQRGVAHQSCARDVPVMPHTTFIHGLGKSAGKACKHDPGISHFTPAASCAATSDSPAPEVEGSAGAVKSDMERQVWHGPRE